MRIYSVGLLGVNPFLIEVESAAAQGLPLTTILGLPETQARAMRERVSTALESSKIKVTHKRLTINFMSEQPYEIRLSRIPADLLDLPLALLMLCESSPAFRNQLFPKNEPQKVLAVGQLSLAGELRPLGFWAPIARLLTDETLGFTKILTPQIASAFFSTIQETFRENSARHTVCEHLCGNHITDFLHHKRQDLALTAQCLPSIQFATQGEAESQAKVDPSPDLFESLKQKPFEHLIALCAREAGLHCLFAGPPGVGKTFLANLIAENQKPLAQSEAASLALIQGEDKLLKRPVRKPHHSATAQSFTGGAKLNLGELGLAHTGVLFLDEIAEFPPATLEVLREPLDDGKIRLSRALGQLTYPAKFQLLATMNPCPCGYHLHEAIPCRCPPTRVKKYLAKLGGPLLDRIHIQVWLEPETLEKSGANAVAEELLQSRHSLTQRYEALSPKKAPIHHHTNSLREQRVEAELLTCLEGLFPNAQVAQRKAALSCLRSFKQLLMDASQLY